ncbi:sugar-binding domain-containing protein [Pelagicoccus sp. SDUM812003]|uniref:sugar-binding domain-containing protein n=1 Tax=Pelagicoccus sp. SDUM812003 TaxID=3041267 RepID=UPI0028118069|nr:sugar-binding domain-containing protein [Pelagicoccus sp. SDUM812003]
MANLSVQQLEGSLKRTETVLDRDWQFSLSPGSDVTESELDATLWKSVRVPHDWSVEASFQNNLEGATGYLPGGIGWYQKRFSLPPTTDETCVYLVFDGIYNNAEVWLNGHFLGQHPYGYSPFHYEISSLLSGEGEENLLRVKVDRTRYADSRWYTGSGIYRDVKVIVADALHVPVWGTYFTTPSVTPHQALVDSKVTVRNSRSHSARFALRVTLFSPDGSKVAQAEETGELKPGEEQEFAQRLTVAEPMLWGVERASLYRAVTEVYEGERLADRIEDRIGIRSIRFDPDQGFFLNGKNMKIKGVCLHHDGGAVGAAVPKDVWRRRLKTLQAGGCNAVRMAHNPASEELIELCDEMGILVQQEFFDEWDYPKDKRLNQNEKSVDAITRGYTEHFQDWAERDLKSTMLRDRNNPSIIQWSIGNEIEWTYPRHAYSTGFFDMKWDGNYFWSLPPHSPEEIKRRYEAAEPEKFAIADTAKRLADWTREMDTTRPVIANCILPSASYISGYTDALDMVGYSYRRVVYDYGHRNYPDKPIMGTENLGQWHEWKAVIERPFIAGMFIWTGIDYMGEANGQWPRKGTHSGLLDLAGFQKPSYHMMKSLWTDQPHLFLATQLEDKSDYRRSSKSGVVVEKEKGAWQKRLWFWNEVNEHWNYDDGEWVVVEVYSNCEEVELLLNGSSLGIQRLSDQVDRVFKWAVPFEAGRLEARGSSGIDTAAMTLETAASPVVIELHADRGSMKANGRDVTHVVAQLRDEMGRAVRHENREIVFSVDGDARILGVDNGAITNVQDFQSNRITTANGRCLLLLQSNFSPSEVSISASGERLQGDHISVEIQ